VHPVDDKWTKSGRSVAYKWTKSGRSVAYNGKKRHSVGTVSCLASDPGDIPSRVRCAWPI
jgi:hypothetical protein